MTDFYLKTDDHAVGPFTGIELREAAMARLLRPETGVASRHGPFVRAVDAGLFSEKLVPLPHPPGTAVPTYELTGVGQSPQGTFKLRELIELATRSTLPIDALIRAVGRQDWLPVTRIAILRACLKGELVADRLEGKRRRKSSTG